MQEKFAVIEDPRQQGYVKHKLCDILTMVMCAVICGLDELGTVVTLHSEPGSVFQGELWDSVRSFQSDVQQGSSYD